MQNLTHNGKGALMTNLEILDLLNERVYGHVQTKKVLISAFRRAQIRWQQWQDGASSEDLLELKNVLLVGDSGTGKTHMISQLADIMEMPFIAIDASDLVPAGNDSGTQLKDIFKKIDRYAEQYLKDNASYRSRNQVLNNLIFFVDEFDKLSTSSTYDRLGGWLKNVQQHFLKLFENGFEYKGITWIFAGAFSYLKEVKQSKPIGFNISHNTDTDTSLAIDDQVLIKNGFIPELIGRIEIISVLDKFTTEDYEHLLDSQIWPKKQKELNYLGHADVTLSPEEKEKIVKKVFKSGQGVRSLKRELNRLFEEYEFNCELTKSYKNEVSKIKNIQSLVDSWTDKDWEKFNYGMEKYK